MSGSNGLTVVGPDARRARWASWHIALVAGRLFIGRLVERPNDLVGGHPQRHLQPFYDFNSGFVPTPSGLAEMHRAFPPFALSLKRLDLPASGYVLWPFTDLDDSELEGIEGQVTAAEELWNKMRAARSAVVLAPGANLSKLPKLPSH